MPRISKKRFVSLRSKTGIAKAVGKSESAGGTTSWGKLVLALLIIAVAVIATYGQAMYGPFIFDDQSAIVENKTIRSVWPLSQSMWGPRDLPTAGRPLVNLSFALNFAVGRLDVFGYHLVNVVLHLFNAALLFAMLHRWSTRSEQGETLRQYGVGMSLAITALWALHPMQTETVSYVTQRSELLMAFFFLLTLYFARRAWDAESRNTRVVWQWVCILSCGFGMGCKEVMVVAPIMVVLYDVTVLQQSFSLLVKRRWPLYIGLFSTWGVLLSLMATNPRGRTVGLGLIIKPHEYLTTQFWAITQYLRLAIWPVGLCADYGVFKITEYATWLPCMCLLIFLSGLSIWAWFRKPMLSFLGGWFFLILAPTSSFVPIVSEPVAERRMYLPLAAVLVLVALGLFKLIEWCCRFLAVPPRDLPSIIRTAMAFAIVSLCLVYTQLTFARNRVYESDLAFWTDVIQKRPANARGYNNLGIAYLNIQQWDRAKEQYRKALAIAPNDADAHYNLGKWYADRGFPTEALYHYDRSIAINPDIADSYYNRGVLFSSQGRMEEAIRSYQAAIRVDLELSVAYLNLGNAYLSQQRFDDAIEQYQVALRLDPRSSIANSNLGGALAQSGKFQEAIEALLRALKIDPNKSEAYFNLGFSYASLGRTIEAREAYKQCLAINPNDTESRLALQGLQ